MSNTVYVMQQTYGKSLHKQSIKSDEPSLNLKSIRPDIASWTVMTV